MSLGDKRGRSFSLFSSVKIVPQDAMRKIEQESDNERERGGGGGEERGVWGGGGGRKGVWISSKKL